MNPISGHEGETTNNQVLSTHTLQEGDYPHHHAQETRRDAATTEVVKDNVGNSVRARNFKKCVPGHNPFAKSVS